MVLTHEAPYTDVVELCLLLQCLGFNVKSMDTSDGNLSQDAGTRTVVINCQSSGIHVVLESASSACSCPVNHHQNSGFWQVSAISGGKQRDTECGSSLLGSLPKASRERLSRDLTEIVKCIKEQNESNLADVSHNVTNQSVEMQKSHSAIELNTTPEKIFQHLKPDTPTRYRSLDTLTNAKAADDQLPPPGYLAKHVAVSDASISEAQDNQVKKTMCRRQSTYTLARKATPPQVGIRLRNKTSSPIHSTQSTLLENLVAAEKAAEDLRNKLSALVLEFNDETKDSSISSLALDVSKISLLKGPEHKATFASSPNLSGLSTFNKEYSLTHNKLKRYECASTSNLVPAKPVAKDGGSKLSKLRRLSPNFFKKKESPATKANDSKTKLNAIPTRPRIVTPVRIPKANTGVTPSPLASKKKFSNVKSTIPRPAVKKD